MTFLTNKGGRQPKAAAPLVNILPNAANNALNDADLSGAIWNYLSQPGPSKLSDLGMLSYAGVYLCLVIGILSYPR